jgi:hypothetical protein
MSRPSGPVDGLVSVWKASTCRFERSFGAMCGWAGGSGAAIGFGDVACPSNSTRPSVRSPSGIGVAPAAAGAAARTVSASVRARFTIGMLPPQRYGARRCSDYLKPSARKARTARRW